MHIEQFTDIRLSHVLLLRGLRQTKQQGLAVLHNVAQRAMSEGSRFSHSGLVIGIASTVGLAAFLYPFVLPALARAPEQQARSSEAPILFAIVTILCLLAIVLDVQPKPGGQQLQHAAKTAALLGVLVAADSALRLVPTFLGASPIFPLIIITGAVFGSVIGFQMGALTLLVSAFITGGIGPWLPFQMLVAGWVGLTAGWIPRFSSTRLRLIAIAALGGFWGFGYGAIMNLWSWPFAAPGLQEDAGLYWNAGLSTTEAIANYAQFYLVTSLWYDAFRAVGNVVLILAFGAPVLVALQRFHRRLTWQPWTSFECGSDTPAHEYIA